jgi:ABC-type nitrate/sulfonate/bicarbonate transport system permease component
MIHANAQLQVELVFASIFSLSILGMGLYGLVVVVERLLIPWRHGESNK